MSALISTEGLAFAIRYGWRQWRHQRLQWSLLALGLACFSALLLLLLQLRAQLQEPIPSWASPAGKIASVYRQNAQGQFDKHSNVVLNKLSQLADVSAVARVRFTKADLRLAEKNLDNMPVLLYTPNIVGVLGLPAPFMPQTDEQAQPVYLSHWAWVLLGKPPLTELNVKVRQFDKDYRIAAVLPPALDRFSEHRPALWLPWADRFLPHFKTDDLDAAGRMPGPKAIAFSENLPGRNLAFVKLRGAPDLTALAAELDQLPDQWLGEQQFRMLEAAHHSVLLPGIELFPEQRDDLWRQWWLLLGLTLLAGAVVAINLLLCQVGQLVRRQHEIGMRQLLGARTAGLSGQLLLEQLPLWLVAVGGGALLYQLGAQQLVSVSIYQQYFGGQGWQFSWTHALQAVLVLTLFLLLCSQLPLLWLLRQSRLFRNRQGHSSAWQQWGLKLQLMLQMSFAALALCVALSLQAQLKAQLQESQLYPQEEVTLRLQPGIRPDAAMQQGQLNGIGGVPLAVSATQFTDKSEAQILHDKHGQSLEFFADIHEVSSHYLVLLQAPLLAGSLELGEDGAVINQALADQLRSEGQPYSALLGQTVRYVFGQEKQVRIVGVIANLPHQGLAAARLPAFYLLLKPSPWYAHPLLTVTTLPAHTLALADQLEDWAWRQGSEVELVFNGTLQQQLERMNEPNWLFARTALVLAVLISGLAALSLYYQVQAQLLLQQSRLATMLAVGASPQRLQLGICLQHAALAAGSLLLALVLLQLSAPWLNRQMNTVVWEVQTVPLTGALLLLIVLLATLLPAWRLLRQPVLLLLQGRAA